MVLDHDGDHLEDDLQAVEVFVVVEVQAVLVEEVAEELVAGREGHGG